MVMRLNLIVCVALAVARAAAAQTAAPIPTGTIPPLRGPLPTGSIPGSLAGTSGAIPLPRIGLPLPSIGLPAVGVSRSVSGRRGHDRGFARSVVGGFWWPNVVYVVPDASLFAPVVAPAPAAVAPAPLVESQPAKPATGTLVIDVLPGTAEMFVDGYYVGRADDVVSQRGDLALEPGPHTVRIDAAGYETVSFNVKITATESIRYRHDLKPIAGAAPPATAVPSAAKPKTIYLIPGCYLGDVPPKDAALPATCDVSQTITLKP